MRTTDSDHDQPIFRDRRKEVALDRPDRLWVADLTYVAIATGFVYVAVILDAWSRRVVGYALGRTLDARLTVAALKVAIERRQPPPGCRSACKFCEPFDRLPSTRSLRRL